MVEALITAGLADLLELSFVGCLRNVLMDFFINIYNFINNLFDKDKKSFNINLEDEIIEKTIIK